MLPRDEKRNLASVSSGGGSSVVVRLSAPESRTRLAGFHVQGRRERLRASTTQFDFPTFTFPTLTSHRKPYTVARALRRLFGVHSNVPLYRIGSNPDLCPFRPSDRPRVPIQNRVSIVSGMRPVPIRLSVPRTSILILNPRLGVTSLRNKVKRDNKR